MMEIYLSTANHFDTVGAVYDRPELRISRSIRIEMFRICRFFKYETFQFGCFAITYWAVIDRPYSVWRFSLSEILRIEDWFREASER